MKVESISSTGFRAGLTKQMQSEILSCNVKDIESYFIKNNICADFKENKFVAWCSLKCLELIKEFNKKYNINLGLPNGIFVEDFRKLKNVNESSAGLANFAPTHIYLDKDVVVPEKTIFYNTYNIDWSKIDFTSDVFYEKGITTTDFFLENVFHEFMHVVHESNLMNKLSGKDLVKQLFLISQKQYLDNFHMKYADFFSTICRYAGANPMETVACDLSKRGVNSINKETLTAKQNPFKNSPYEKRLFFTNKGTKKDVTLRKFWNGKFMF